MFPVFDSAEECGAVTGSQPQTLFWLGLSSEMPNVILDVEQRTGPRQKARCCRCHPQIQVRSALMMTTTTTRLLCLMEVLFSSPCPRWGGHACFWSQRLCPFTLLRVHVGSVRKSLVTRRRHLRSAGASVSHWLRISPDTRSLSDRPPSSLMLDTERLLSSSPPPPPLPPRLSQLWDFCSSAFYFSSQL